MNKKRQRTEIGGDNGFEEWGGYMAAKKNKLQGQFQDQVKKQDQEVGTITDIFKNVSVFVNGYTVPSADDIKRIMMVNGGVYHHYFSTQHTTHIIATNLPDVKIKQLKSLHVNVVKPEWITACLDAGRQVDFRPFLLYSHQSRNQPSIRSFGGPQVSASSTVDGPSTSGLGGSSMCQKSNESPVEDSNSRDSEIDYANRESSEDLFATPEEKAMVQGAENNLPNSNNSANMISESGEAMNIARHAIESDEDLFASPEENKTYSNAKNCIINSSTSPELNDESRKTSSNARCATDPNFLSEFYNNSRLHHISTMGAMFKQLVSEMRQKKNDFSGLKRLKAWKEKESVKINFKEDEDDFSSSLSDNSAKPSHSIPSSVNRKVIMHIDMDCFFVSVGLRRFPHLKGKPVAVTHSKGNGTVVRNGSDRKFEFNYYREKLEAKMKHKNHPEDEGALQDRLAWMDGIDENDSMAEIASCSYEARKKGLKNGMFVGAALKLCPDLKVIPYDFEGYNEVAKTLYDTVASYTTDIEAVSCDEMFVDCTDLLQKTLCTPIEFATFLRKEIKEKTLCTASTGFGSNRLLARLATRKAKPDGMFYLEPSMVLEFMEAVEVKDLPGVGRSMSTRLQAMGVFTCGDLQKISKSELCEMGEKTGALLYKLCRGQDDRPLNFDHQRKSVSAEVNYGIRFKNEQEAEAFIRQLSGEVQTRLAEAKVKGSCITLKLLLRAKDAPTETAKYMGHGVCDNISRSSTLSRAVSDADVIAGEVLQMMKKLSINPCDMRGIGIQISRLESLNSSSAGALDKFLCKNTKGNASNSVSESPSKLVKPASSPKGKTGAVMVTPSKKKIFSNRGTIDQFMNARKKTARKDDVSKLPAPSDLDLEVLEALPDDIRNELLQAYSANPSNATADLANPQKANEQSRSTTSHSQMEISYSQVDPTFLEALPVDMREELKADFHQRKVQKEKEKQTMLSKTFDDAIPGPSHSYTNKRPYCYRKNSILRDAVLKQEDIKTMIRIWVSEEEEPQPCDVHLLEHYLCDLVHERSIDDLYIIFKVFRRCVSSHSSLMWKKKFHDILSTVQASMQLVYQSSLQVEDFEVISNT